MKTKHIDFMFFKKSPKEVVNFLLLIFSPSVLELLEIDHPQKQDEKKLLSFFERKKPIIYRWGIFLKQRKKSLMSSFKDPLYFMQD